MEIAKLENAEPMRGWENLNRQRYMCVTEHRVLVVRSLSLLSNLVLPAKIAVNCIVDAILSLTNVRT